MFHVKRAVEWTFTAKKLKLGYGDVYFELTRCISVSVESADFFQL